SASLNVLPRSRVTKARRVLPASKTNTRAQRGSRLPVESFPSFKRSRKPYIGRPGGGEISALATAALNVSGLEQRALTTRNDAISAARPSIHKPFLSPR